MAPVKIISYQAELKPYFESINRPWVEQYFCLEPFDRLQLEQPEEQVIAKGGAILFAEDETGIIGTVGLLPTADPQVYELIKMGVVPEARGKKIGLHLVEAILQKAKELGASKVVLYTHDKLAAALRIYEMAGFALSQPECGKYVRCNIRMEKIL